MLVKYMEQFRQKGEFSARVNGFSRDSVVDKLWDRNNFHNNSRDKEDIDNGVELSLGLSLNGRFGVDPKKDRIRLIRSSSVSASYMVGADDCAARLVPVTPAPYEPLSRTFSVPTDAEAENWRKRKQLQSLRRMEARRRRMDKIKVLRYEREKIDLEDNSSEEVGSNTNSSGSSLVSSINGNGMVWSQISMGLESSNSSGFAEFESQSQPVQDRNKLRRSSSVQFLQIQNGQKVQVIPRLTVEKTIDKEATKAKEMVKDLMHEMPGVSTIGNGPNGRKIDGFLYRYGKGEEVKIMCVCHGSFLSPAEFVKHAGGTEVDNPLRHIVVNPSPIL